MRSLYVLICAALLQVAFGITLPDPVTGLPPPGNGTVSPPSPPGNFTVPPPPSGNDTVSPPSPPGNFTVPPPPSGNSTVSPPSGNGTVSPPSGNGTVSPPSPPGNFTLRPPPGNFTLPPPGNFTFTPPTNSSVPTRHPPNNDTFIGCVLYSLHQQAPSVQSSYSEFYYYHYDGINRISDGGNDMYDGGNQVSFSGYDHFFVQARYNNVFNGFGYQAGIHDGYPFNSLMWIGDTGGSYSILVNSGTGADRSGNIATFNGTMHYGNVTLSYAVFQIYGAGDPTICEVYYTVSDPSWNSTKGNFSSSFATITDPTTNIVSLESSPRNVFLGYTLLSRWPGRQIMEYEVRTVLYSMLHAFIYDIVECPLPDLVTPNFTTPQATTVPFTTTGPFTNTVPFTTTSPPTALLRPVSRSVQAIRGLGQRIRSQVTNFYSYNYDGNLNSILDGGNDMYDRGNIVSVGKVSPSYGIYYGQSASLNDFAYASSASHPFVTLIYVGENSTSHNYTIQVISNAGADNSGSAARMNGTITLNCTIHYEVFQLYGTNDPTIGEVYFTVSSFAWFSSPVFLSLDVTSSDQNNLLNRATARSYVPIRNIFMGYMLLSKRSGQFISRWEIEGALRETAMIIGAYAFNDAPIPTPIPVTTPLPTTTFTDFTTDFNTNFTATTPISTRPPPTNDTFVGSVFTCLHYSSYSITGSVYDFFFYRYDGFNSINDGGNDMYDGGNQVYFGGPYNNRSRANYDQVTYGIGYQAGTHTGYPFNALMWIGEGGGSYSIEVSGDAGADGTGNITTTQGTIYYNDVTVEYRVFQISGASFRDPTICEVYYSVRNYNWQSSGGYNFYTSFSSNTDQLTNIATLGDSPRRMFLGYTLLSSANGRFIESYEIYNAMYSIAHCFAQVVPPPPTPTPTFSPTFTTPTGSPPPPVSDLDFLPSCSLREAIRRVWSCESAFTADAPYSDPNQCRSNINTVIHCVANKLTQCASGHGPNVFRRYNIPFDIQFIIQQIRYLAFSSPTCYSYDPINSFCQKSSLPHHFDPAFNNMTDFFLCHPRATEGLISNLTHFYYAYVGARTAGEICMAYRKFRDGFVPTVRHQCSLEAIRYIFDFQHPELYNYVLQAANVVLDSLSVLEISSCPKIAVNNSRARISTEWLKAYAKWRSVSLPRWQRSYNRWVESLDSLYRPLPEVPHCRHLTGIRCRDPAQYTCTYDFFNCQLCYCLDNKYNGLTQAMLEPWKEDFHSWMSFMEEWDNTYHSWEMNDGVL